MFFLVFFLVSLCYYMEKVFCWSRIEEGARFFFKFVLQVFVTSLFYGVVIYTAIHKIAKFTCIIIGYFLIHNFNNNGYNRLPHSSFTFISIILALLIINIACLIYHIVQLYHMFDISFSSRLSSEQGADDTKRKITKTGNYTEYNIFRLVLFFSSFVFLRTIYLTTILTLQNK
jgi:hypothetical protein